MVMANLPDKVDSSAELDKHKEMLELIADQIAAGRKPGEIARRLAPNDSRKRKYWRSRIRNMLYDDPNLALALSKRAKASALTDLVPAVEAMGSRARRGRMDAVKGIMETTGFHNPRVKHEHSGDIKLTLEIPRPSLNGEAETEATDAEVVDD